MTKEQLKKLKQNSQRPPVSPQLLQPQLMQLFEFVQEQAELIAKLATACRELDDRVKLLEGEEK